MKIKYEFANETVEIEVDEEWGNLLIDLERREYNNDHAETRRHVSLDAMNLDDAYLPSNTDVIGDVIRKADAASLHAAIRELEPQQQELVRRVWFGGEKMADIAKQESVSRAAITRRMNKIYAALEKKLK